jgi:hypothetical protein
MAHQVQGWGDAAIGPSGRAVSEVVLPAGTIEVPDTINLTNVYGLVILGFDHGVGLSVCSS